MKTSKHSCNHTVPAPEEPGSPHLAFYDDGNWEIARNADVEYLNMNPRFVGSISFGDLFEAIDLELDIGETIDIIDDEVMYISFNEVLYPNFDDHTTVIMFWESGEIDCTYRYHAEQLVADEDTPVFNFTTVGDFIDEFNKWMKSNAHRLFEKSYDEDPFLDEDDEQ